MQIKGKVDDEVYLCAVSFLKKKRLYSEAFRFNYLARQGTPYDLDYLNVTTSCPRTVKSRRGCWRRRGSCPAICW